MTVKSFFHTGGLPFLEARKSTRSQSHFSPHMHRRFSIGAVNEGEVTFQVGNDVEVLRPGALALINPELIHSCNSEEKQARSYYMLYLDVEWCAGIQKSIWGVDSFVCIDTIILHDQGLYTSYCSCMESIFSQEIFLEEKEQAVTEVVATIFQTSNPNYSLLENHFTHMSHFKRRLSEDLSIDLSLENISREFSVNLYTLIRQFKKETGLTPHAYRVNCRIEKARELLRQGCDIGEVALLCGFFDQSHFHKYFKRATTMTPKKYQVNFLQ